MQRATLNFETLLEVTNALNSQRDIESLWRVIADQIQKVIPWDRAGITLYEPSTDSFRFYAVITNMATPALAHDSVIPRKGSAVGWVYDHRRPHIREDLQQQQVFLEDGYYVREGLGRMINLPLLVREHCLGTLNIGGVQPGTPDPDDCKFLQQVATQIAYAIDHVLAYQQIKQLSEQLRRENEYLAAEVKASRDLRLVVGTSPSFTKVVDLLKAVAPTDTTVLLLGETGTGKEVLAQALHDLSTRCDKPFIRVNCAALPSGLIESELFGHERGAFTGAQLRKPGRFELAHTGTLFLDEIGEMPIETQAKLLRVLQDGMVD
ncbi:MAG TPA: sigma 54-interacting transcriptional regulator, partial [Nitrospira sp.]|nr:sigma 54-interacting transcriptional regulator [Nitrospira sp.]